MRIHAVAQASDLAKLDLAGWSVVVIDAIRASSTIAQAVASGCGQIIPVATVDEALKVRESSAPAKVLLCGERGGLMIPGFDLGNSPREFTREAVSGKTLVFTTTNGTRAMVASASAKEVIIGAFLNMPAVIAYLIAERADVLIVPVGRDDKPVLDDVVCGGMYADRLDDAPDARLDAGAELVRMVYLGYRGRLLDAALDSPSGKNLVQIGIAEDLAIVTQVGLLNVVPKVVDGIIRGT